MPDIASDPWLDAINTKLAPTAAPASPAAAAVAAPAEASGDPWLSAVDAKISGKPIPKADAPKSEGGALSYVNNLVRQAANAASLGTANYMDAGAAALGNSAANLWNGRSANLGGEYDKAIAAQRQQDTNFANENPVAATTANLAGGVGGGLAMPASLPERLGIGAVTRIVPTQAGKAIVGGGLFGAGLGAAEGAISTPGDGTWSGDIANRAEGALHGGLFGAAGGAIVPGVIEAGQGIAKGVGKGIGFLSPAFSKEAAELQAGQKLVKTAADPNAAITAIDNAPNNGQIVPGSQPTTGQLTGDMSLLNLERQAETSNPVPFQNRRAEQNTARTGSVNTLAPEGADANAPGQLFDNRLGQLQTDAADAGMWGQQRLADAQAAGQRSVANAEAQGQRAVADANNLRSQADLEGQGRLATADQTGRAAVANAEAQRAAAIGDLGGELRPEQYGANLREQMTPVRAAAKAEAGQGFDALRGQGITLDASAPQAAVAKVQGAMTNADRAVGLNPSEAKLYDIIGGWKGPQPWEEVQSVSSHLQRLQRELQPLGESPELRRITQVKQSIDGMVNDAANAGGQTTAGANFPPQAAQQYRDAKAAWRDYKQTWSSPEIGSKNAVGNSLAAGPKGSEYRLTNEQAANAMWDARAASPDDVRAFTRAMGGQPQAVQTYMDMAASRLRAAALDPRTGQINRAAWQKWMTNNGDALRALDGLSGSAALRQRFNSLPAAQEMVDHATARHAASVSAAQADAAAASRMAADQVAGAQSAAAGGVKTAATEAANKLSADAADVAATQRMAEDQVKTYQNGVAKEFLGGKDPVNAISKAMSGGDRAQKMFNLMAETNGHPDAKAGMQQAFVDYMKRTMQTAAEAGTSGEKGWSSAKLQKFATENGPALRAVFGEEGAKNIEAVAKDLAMADRSINAVKLPGRSNTPQDLMGKAKSIFSELIGHGGGALAGAAVATHGASGGISAAGLAVGAALRKMGLGSVNDVVTRALLDPAFAREIMVRASEQNLSMAAKRLAATPRNIRLGGAAGLTAASVASGSR